FRSIVLVPSSSLRSTDIRPFDLAVGAAAPWLALILRDFDYLYRAQVSSLVIYSLFAAGCAAFALGYFRIGRILARYMSISDVKQILKASAATATLSAVLCFMFARLDAFPRSLPALQFIVMAGAIIGERFVRKEWYDRQEFGRPVDRHQPGEAVLVVGATRLAWLYARMLGCMSRPQQRIVGLVDENPRIHHRSMSGHPIVGGLADLDRLLNDYAVHGVPIDRILIAYTDLDDLLAAEREVDRVCTARGLPWDVLSRRLNLGDADGAEEVSVAETTPARPPEQASAYLRLRRAIDIVLSGTAILVFAPVMAAVAIVVLADVGAPLVFWQERVGRYGRRIMIHKFRTLRDPTDRAGRLLSDEERLSGVGRLLRATRLDELPQLFDVLRGDMSLIGPRPLLPIDLPQEESVRLQVRPGVTGWAQVHGGKLISAEEKNALDEWYIFHVSPRVDLHIVRLTLLMPFRGDKRREKGIHIALNFRRGRMEEKAEAARAEDAPPSGAAAAATSA
ncbi:MAG TPA: sugar transferase, partial [Beijerinckiaceae bacterium]